jgi:hypothetical protein
MQRGLPSALSLEERRTGLKKQEPCMAFLDKRNYKSFRDLESKCGLDTIAENEDMS